MMKRNRWLGLGVFAAVCLAFAALLIRLYTNLGVPQHKPAINNVAATQEESTKNDLTNVVDEATTIVYEKDLPDDLKIIVRRIGNTGTRLALYETIFIDKRANEIVGGVSRLLYGIAVDIEATYIAEETAYTGDVIKVVTYSGWEGSYDHFIDFYRRDDIGPSTSVLPSNRHMVSVSMPFDRRIILTNQVGGHLDIAMATDRVCNYTTGFNGGAPDIVTATGILINDVQTKFAKPQRITCENDDMISAAYLPPFKEPLLVGSADAVDASLQFVSPTNHTIQVFLWGLQSKSVVIH